MKRVANVILTVEPHPHLKLAAFVTRFPAALGALPAPAWLVELLRCDTEAPLRHDEATRTAVRELLRHGGYKPTGRGKPASEYLVRAAQEGALKSINAAADAGNAVALHSGLPVSVLDLAGLVPPLRVGIAAAGARFLFNAAGQEIDVGGLLCLHDAAGPCANAVKDAQRTKTHAATRATLSLVWGVLALPDRLAAAVAWYEDLLARLGAATEAAALTPTTS
jgi:DNA/RNA-binding domain of Phe-tRNA-synthetase-like protein